MIFLGLDFLLSFFSDIPTFFVLFSILLYHKNKIFTFLLIPLTIDLLITNTYFFFFLLFGLLFLMVKYLKITKTSFKNFWVLITLVYLLYVFSLGLIRGYTLLYLFRFILTNYFINLIFYVLCYKIFFPYIKLSRW